MRNFFKNEAYMGEDAPDSYRGKRVMFFTEIEHCFWTYHDYQEICPAPSDENQRESRDNHDLVGGTDWWSLNTKVTLRYFSPDNYYESYVSLTISY